MSTPPVHSRRGGLLLECVLSLALFVMAAIAVSSAVVRAFERAESSYASARAMDAARSAMGLIVAGEARPDAFNGEVPRGSLTSDAEVGTDQDTLVVMEVTTAPSEISGLTVVRIRAWEAGHEEWRVSLDRLVRIAGIDAGDVAP